MKEQAPEPKPEAASPSLGGKDLVREELAAALKPEYELLRQLGQGGMGWVFLAREPALKRLVAVKLLAPYLQFDERSRSRFEREARAAAVLFHPNLVQVIRIGQTAPSGLPYIVMQYIEGPSLKEWLTEHGKAAERDARRILGSVASALSAAHQRGLVHRDVKPANILIETATGRVFLTDFGIAAALSPAAVGEAVHLTDTNTQVGTPAYMSPEQALGERVSPRSDVYSLGMVAYELLAGALPFHASTPAAWTAAHLRDGPVPLRQRRPELPADLSLIIDRCLAKTAEERPDSEEIARGMLPWLEEEIEWPPPGMRQVHQQGDRLGRWGLLTTVAGLLVLWCLAWPPASTLAYGQWWERFSSDVRASSASPLGLRRIEAALPQDTLVRTWQVALVLGLAVLIGGFVRMTTLTRTVAERARSQRRSGWSWATILDALADPDGRSGLLLSGERECAALPPADRIAILENRRRTTGALMVSGLGFPAIFGAWALWQASGLLAPDGPGPVIGIPAALGIGLLPAVCLAIGILALTREARLMGPLPRRRSHSYSTSPLPSDPAPPEITAWYTSQSLPVPSDQHPKAPAEDRDVRAAYATFQVFCFLVVAGLGLLGGATLVAAGNVRNVGPASAELADSLNTIERDDPFGAARQIWRPLLSAQQSLGGQGAVSANREVNQPTAATDTTQPVQPSDLLEALGTNPDGEPPETYILLRALRQDIRGDTLRLLEQIVATSPVGGDEPGGQLDHPRLRHDMLVNLLGAALALNRGDLELAENILGRSGRMAEGLLDSPNPFDPVLGAGALRTLALRPLALIRQSRGDSVTATRLRLAADRVMGLASLPAWNTGARGIAADPHDWSVYSGLLSDRRLLPAQRLVALRGARDAYCLNPREILGGPSQARTPALLAMADSMADLAGTDTIILNETNYLQPTRVQPRFRRLLPWPLIGGLIRLNSCRGLGR